MAVVCSEKIVRYCRQNHLRAQEAWQPGSKGKRRLAGSCFEDDVCEGEIVLRGQDDSHLALDLAADDVAAFTEKLRHAGVRQWQKNSSDSHAVYFLDPDGNKPAAHSGSLQTRLNSLKDCFVKRLFH